MKNMLTLKAEVYDLITKQAKLNTESQNISKLIQQKSSEISKIQNRKNNKTKC